MPNPKKKHTRMRTGMRRAMNWRLKIPTITQCPSCKNFIEPHTVCGVCGSYAEEIINPPKPKKEEK
ncbi:MAG: 50S ribosomal protein L32 [bacterium]|nr:50S ribosomal protein L32 [bacterium]